MAARYIFPDAQFFLHASLAISMINTIETTNNSLAAYTTCELRDDTHAHHAWQSSDKDIAGPFKWDGHRSHWAMEFKNLIYFNLI